MSVQMFCMVGKHAGPVCGETPQDKCESTRGWRELPASKKDGKWVYDASSACAIYVCPDHVLPGEPGLN